MDEPDADSVDTAGEGDEGLDVPDPSLSPATTTATVVEQPHAGRLLIEVDPWSVCDLTRRRRPLGFR